MLPFVFPVLLIFLDLYQPGVISVTPRIGVCFDRVLCWALLLVRVGHKNSSSYSCFIIICTHSLEASEDKRKHTHTNIYH